MFSFLFSHLLLFWCEFLSLQFSSQKQPNDPFIKDPQTLLWPLAPYVTVQREACIYLQLRG